MGGNDWRCPKRNLSRYTLQVSMGSSNASLVQVHDPHVGTRASNSPSSHSTPDWSIQGSGRAAHTEAGHFRHYVPVA